MKQYKKNNYTGSRKRDFESIKTLLDMGSDSKALAEVIRYIEKYPTDMYGHFLHGRILLKFKDYEGAKEAFMKVAESNSKNRYTAYENLAFIAQKENNFDLARQYYHKVISESKFSKKYSILECSKIERRAKDGQAALNVLEYGDPNDNDIKLEKSRSYLVLGDVDMAVEVLDSIDSNDSRIRREMLYERGVCEKISNNFDVAKNIFELLRSVGEKDELYYQALYEEAVIANEEGNYEHVIECCEELDTREYHYNNELYLLLGIARQETRKYEKAISCYRMAIDSYDKSVRGHAKYRLGTLLFAKGDIKEAEKVFENLVYDENDRENGSYFKLISIYIRQGKIEEARKCFERLVDGHYYTCDDNALNIIDLIIRKAEKEELVIEKKMRYTEKQLVSYSEEHAIKHIMNNHKNGDNKNSQFSADIDIEELYYEIRTLMTDENRINETVLDIYEIDKANCGYQDGEILNKVRVVAIPGTKDIITMYPSNKKTLPRQSDFVEKNNKNRSLDRLSRFNARYGNMLNNK